MSKIKIVKESLTKQISQALEKKISSGEYIIGDKIPTEPQLVEYFGVSRNTVREAVQSLIHAGVLESRQGNGTYVRAKGRLQVELFNLFSKTQYQEVEEVRILIEEYAAGYVALNRTDEELKKIKATLENVNFNSSVFAETTHFDIEFHKSIVEATHNSFLISMYSYLSQYLNEFTKDRLIIHKENQSKIETLHEDLFQAIKDKNPEKAKQLTLAIIEF